MKMFLKFFQGTHGKRRIKNNVKSSNAKQQVSLAGLFRNKCPFSLVRTQKQVSDKKVVQIRNTENKTKIINTLVIWS